MEQISNDNKNIEKILRKRAEKLSLRIDEKEQVNLKQYLHFAIANQSFYGINYNYLHEIVQPQSITKIPGINSFIYGVINNRSDIVTVIDIRYFFNIAMTPINNPWVVLVKHQDHLCGVLASEVIGNDYYAPEHLKKSIHHEVNFCEGIHNGCVSILDVEKLLNDEKIIVKNGNKSI